MSNEIFTHGFSEVGQGVRYLDFGEKGITARANELDMDDAGRENAYGAYNDAVAKFEAPAWLGFDGDSRTVRRRGNRLASTHVMSNEDFMCGGEGDVIDLMDAGIEWKSEDDEDYDYDEARRLDESLYNGDLECGFDEAEAWLAVHDPERAVRKSDDNFVSNEYDELPKIEAVREPRLRPRNSRLYKAEKHLRPLVPMKWVYFIEDSIVSRIKAEDYENPNWDVITYFIEGRYMDERPRRGKSVKKTGYNRRDRLDQAERFEARCGIYAEPAERRDPVAEAREEWLKSELHHAASWEDDLFALEHEMRMDELTWIRLEQELAAEARRRSYGYELDSEWRRPLESDYRWDMDYPYEDDYSWEDQFMDELDWFMDDYDQRRRDPFNDRDYDERYLDEYGELPADSRWYLIYDENPDDVPWEIRAAIETERTMAAERKLMVAMQRLDTMVDEAEQWVLHRPRNPRRRDWRNDPNLLTVASWRRENRARRGSERNWRGCQKLRHTRKAKRLKPFPWRAGDPGRPDLMDLIPDYYWDMVEQVGDELVLAC